MRESQQRDEDPRSAFHWQLQTLYHEAYFPKLAEILRQANSRLPTARRIYPARLSEWLNGTTDIIPHAFDQLWAVVTELHLMRRAGATSSHTLSEDHWRELWLRARATPKS